MDLKTSLHGRLRNTNLPKTHGLLPLFEAVVNSIQSLADSNEDASGPRVQVEIVRQGQQSMDIGGDDDGPLDSIVEFRITDYGAGFDYDNMTSFQTLDSEHKLKYGCRGVGRLLWLKAFDRVQVESDFLDSDGQMQRRSFRFSADGVSNHNLASSDAVQSGTRIRLIGFKKVYQENSRKRGEIIARDLMEHCLWYFVRPGESPQIEVRDGFELLKLDAMFKDFMLSSSRVEHFKVKDEQFSMIHLRLRATSRASHMMAWCAADRVVMEEPLVGKVPGLYGRLTENGDDFFYAAFLTADYLDLHVRSERTAFDIPEEATGTIAEQAEVTLSEVRQQVVKAAEQYLDSVLAVARSVNRQRIETFVDTKAPRYKTILPHLTLDRVRADPGISERELELQLHRGQADLEAHLLSEGHEVLHGEADWLEPEHEERLAAYLSKVEDVKKSDLAAYVSGRRVILELLERAISLNEDGSYQREEAVHRLLMPLRTTSDGSDFDAANLWLLDERLAFHNYLASDVPIARMPVTGSTSKGEPDLLALKLIDEPYLVAEGTKPQLASIVVVELKRPMRKNVRESNDKNPINQALGYLDRVRDGDVTTRQGRPIKGAGRIPGFCYIVADLTLSMEECCKQAALTATQDGGGYFGYNTNYNAYIEVIGFDRLLRAAQERNRAFFDKLGLPAI